AFGRGTPDREAPVAVVVGQHHHEGALLPHEEGRRTVAQAFARLGQRETEPPDPLQDAFAICGAHSAIVTRLAGVAQWESSSLPSWLRGFGSRQPLLDGRR